jgi:hypothetical protein
MAFKIKTKNRNPINSKQTLDATHNEIIGLFNKDKEQLVNYKKHIEIIEIKIQQQRKKIVDDNDHIKNMEIQRKIWDLEEELTKQKEKIISIETNEEETNYLLNTGDILKNYYRMVDNEKTDDYKPKPGVPYNKKKNKSNKRTVVDWFENNTNVNLTYNIHTGKPVVILVDKQKKEKNKKDREEFITKKVTKDKLYQQYMSKVQENFIEYYSSDEEYEEIDICVECDTEMLLNQNTGILVCGNCGIQEQVIIDSDKPSYKDPPKEITSFCYKRINHLNEFLAQFQAKETTEIPEDIYNEILCEIKKERITNMADLTTDKLRCLLRKIKRNDYYEHIPYIINQLNGLPPPVISPKVEEVIRSMFKEIQTPFEKYCPKQGKNKRKNFLSYNYVMYKFFELLELDEYLDCFLLLKSRNKLHQQDIIWKSICVDTKWEFIPSL